MVIPRTLFNFVVFFFFVPVLISGCFGSGSAQAHIKKAARHEELSRFDLAETEYEAAVNADPQNALAFFRLGYARQFQGKLDSAESAYLKTIEIDDSFIDAYLNLAALYFEDGWIKKAQDILTDALQKKSDSYAVNLYLGRIFFEKQDYEKAISQFEQAKKIRDDDPVLFYNIGITYIELADYEAAFVNLEKSTQIEKRFLVAYEALARLCNQLGKKEEAAHYLKKRADLGDIKDKKTSLARKMYKEMIKDL